jgi:hypothetical protein
MARSWLLSLVILCGCTIPNPRLKDLGAADMGMADLAQAGDLRGADLMSVDLAPPIDGPLCTTAERCGLECSRCLGTAHQTCDGTKCICGNAMNCGVGETCKNGTCQKDCLVDLDCSTALAGRVCISLMDRRCGCRNKDEHCPRGTTSCRESVCMCGATVCRADQTCVEGVCQ